MPRLHSLKTNFTSGEISSRMLGRGDLRAYDNGAARLRNVFIHPTGGLDRRAGLRFVDTARGRSRLLPFEFNTEQTYLMAFSDGHADVYRDEEHVADFATPWTFAQIGQIAWTQSADTLLIVHPDVAPKTITRTADDAWTVADWVYQTTDEDSVHRIHQPHHKFAADAVTIAASATSGTVTLTASADVFEAGHVGTRFRLQNKEVEVTAVTSATEATATVTETLAGTAATRDWEEQAFSAVRGWPVAVCFHQDRLVVGGSRDLPNRLWLSKSADLYNFDLGEGLDDEAIEFAILSDQVNAIRAVFSGRHLQVMTSGAEWMVSGEPLTPGNIQLHRQTRVGSPMAYSVPPRDVDGATLFVPRDGKGLREFLFADVEQAYQAGDVVMLAQHLFGTVVEQDYDDSRRLFHLVMEDGALNTMTVFRAEQVTAWTRQETDGAFRSVAVVDGATYVLVERDGAHRIEVFDPALAVDSGLLGTAEEPKAAWSGLDHLEGRAVKVVADGAVCPDAIVSGGEITLDSPASAVQVGLGYTHIVEPLPPSGNETPNAGHGGKVRLVSLTLRLKDTVAVRLDTGRGFVDLPFKRFGPAVLDAPLPTFIGDKTVRALGWRPGGTTPLWRIEQDTPLPFTLLSVMAEVTANE